MMVYECDCGQSGTSSFHLAVVKALVCPVCASPLRLKQEFSLSFWCKHKVFVDLDEDFLSVNRKRVLDAIRILQPCSDRDVKKYLGWDSCQVTSRRYELANCSIPFIVSSGRKEVLLENGKKSMATLWIVNKFFNVERELEAKVL